MNKAMGMLLEAPPVDNPPWKEWNAWASERRLTPAAAASDLWEQLGELVGPDLDMVGVAHGLGAEVRRYTGAPASGSLTIEPYGREATVSFQGTNVNRTRFTIAHENGHLILHASTGSSRRQTFDRHGTTPAWQEREANEFAAELLMPRKALQTLLFTTGLTPQRAAEYLKVSHTAFQSRLTNLGLMP